MNSTDKKERLERAYAEWDQANAEVTSSQTVLMAIRPDDSAFAKLEDAYQEALDKRHSASDVISKILRHCRASGGPTLAP